MFSGVYCTDLCVFVGSVILMERVISGGFEHLGTFLVDLIGLEVFMVGAWVSCRRYGNLS